MQESFYTGCPNCKTTFKVTQETLKLAKGKVRCGACLSVFQATDYLLQPKSGQSSSTMQSGEESQSEPD